MNFRSITRYQCRAVLFCIACLLATSTFAQSPVIVNIDTKSPGRLIPEDFNGTSFETVNLKTGCSGAPGYLFDSSNTQVVTLFKQLGIKNLRIGGSTVDGNQNFTPTTKGIDALFRFAKATDVKVIYSVRLFNGNADDDGATAKYIWDNYHQYLDCFSIGNEPQLYHGKDPDITSYSTFHIKWKKFASTITNAAPGAKFSGPDTGPSRAPSWATQFASAEKNSGLVKSIYFHYYVGGGSKNLSIPEIIDNVLSTTWVTQKYPPTLRATGKALSHLGVPYRFTEANSYYTGGATIGVSGGNNCYATALFALDFMHWWAKHGCDGVNFHTTLHPTNWWKYNGSIYLDDHNNYQVRAMAYGIKAFDLGSHGHVMPLKLTNTDSLNLTAYAVGDSTNLYVTLINKEHNTDARSATATIISDAFPSPNTTSVIFLQAPSPSSTNAITLGGAPINNDQPWQGQWTQLNSSANGQCKITVPPTSAAIVRISAEIAAK